LSYEHIKVSKAIPPPLKGRGLLALLVEKEECDLDMRYYQEMVEESGDNDY